MGATEFIKDAGASLVSLNVLDEKGHVKWLVREEPVNVADNGWRVLSEIDTDEFLADPANMVIVDFNVIVEMEPAIQGVYGLPIGSDIQLVIGSDGSRRWFDNLTGQEIPVANATEFPNSAAPDQQFAQPGQFNNTAQNYSPEQQFQNNNGQQFPPFQ